MATDRTDVDGPKSVREKLIEHAQLQTWEARSELQQAQMLQNGEAPRQVRMKLQQAISDYYHALKPLHNRPELEGERDEGWWNTVVLSDEWTTTQYREEQRVGGDVHTGPRIETVTVEEEVPVEGLDAIRDLERSYETETTTQNGLRGRRTETVRRKTVLPGDVLVDIIGVLDEAAGKVGFQPDMEIPEAETDPV
jgi:hypothetical protein